MMYTSVRYAGITFQLRHQLIAFMESRNFSIIHNMLIDLISNHTGTNKKRNIYIYYITFLVISRFFSNFTSFRVKHSQQVFRYFSLSGSSEQRNIIFANEERIERSNLGLNHS